ncbi:MAG: TRAP transporter substrate-binding protein [Alphaproteobacteria bacterium]|nr:TRAP transporter substrate-binding protein [Alphaproteobacteria bacterium]
MSVARAMAGTARSAALAAALAAGCAGATQAAVLRSADTHPDGYPTVEAVKRMGALLREETGGRVSIVVHHSRQLGEERDTIEQAVTGVLDMTRVNLAPFNSMVKETLVPALPFLFRSADHMRRTMDGEIGEQILRAFLPHGLVGLAFYDSGARSFYNAARPIRTPRDMAGLRLRVQQSDLFVALVNALGASATPMAYGEVLSGIQAGIIDGAENNWPSYRSSQHHRAARYYSLTEHSLSPEVLVMSKRSWDRLSTGDQIAVRRAAKRSVPYMRGLWDTAEYEARRAVEAEGAVVNEVDKTPFVAAMKPVYDRLVTDPLLKSLVERVQAVR